jgi:hypothetical protein
LFNGAIKLGTVGAVFTGSEEQEIKTELIIKLNKINFFIFIL